MTTGSSTTALSPALSATSHTADDGIAPEITLASPSCRTFELALPLAPDVDQKLKALTDAVIALWDKQKKNTQKAQRSRDELKLMRLELAGQLHMLKALHAKAGRNGRWSSLLKEHGISRATADRYVALHDRRIAPLPAANENKGVPEPTASQVTARVKKLALSLQAFLTTPASVNQFIDEISRILMVNCL